MIHPQHSRPIDVHRWSDHPEARRITDAVWALPFFEGYREGRVDKGGPRPKIRYKDQLHVLILDLFVAWKTDPDLSIGVAMGVDAWKTSSRYNALHLSKILPTFINLLHQNGLLDLSKGSYSGPGFATNRTTRIRAAEDLIHLFSGADFEVEDVVVAEGRETIILRNDDNPAGTSKPIEYVDTKDTKNWRHHLEAYNALLQKTFIDIPSLDRPYIERMISKGKGTGTTQRIPIGPSNAFVRRVFSRGSWEMNGRFYGGWWQQVSPELRQQIYIDDEPTVEIDFQALHVAILSKEAGIPLVDDPYSLNALIFPDVTVTQQRGYVKHLVLTAINAKSKKSAFRAFRENYSGDALGKHLRDADLERLLSLFLEFYPHLEEKLFADLGILLMYRDSQVAAKVLANFTQAGIPVLCIHDSFIIQARHQKQLASFMQDATSYEFGGTLRTDQKDGEAFINPLYDGEIAGKRTRTNAYLRRLSVFKRRAKEQEPLY